MNCSEVQNVLSAYHDGELAGAERAAVAQHLADCPMCSAALAEFEELSQLAAELREPQAVPAMWDAIAAQLAESSSVESSALVSLSPRPLARRWRMQPIALGLAASLLVATLTGLALWHWGGGHERAHMAVNFDAYLNNFSHDPQAAQQVLLANYNGRRVELNEAENALGYMPAAGARIPDGYAVHDVYLLDMPGCACAPNECPKEKCTQDSSCPCGGICACSQVVYRNSDGRLVSIFEHDSRQPVWFGDRPAITCQFNGMPTDLIQITPQRLAASWMQGKRYITVIGAENIEEIKQIIAQLQSSPASPRTSRVLESGSLEL